MVLPRGNVRVVDGIECDSPRVPEARIGDEMPAYCRLTGRTLMDEISDADIDRIQQSARQGGRTNSFS